MTYATAMTITVGVKTSYGGRAFLRDGQSFDAFRLGTFRKEKRTTPFRVRAVIAPITMTFPSGASLPKHPVKLTCAPNAAKIKQVSVEEITQAHVEGLLNSKGRLAAYQSLILSDPGGIVTIESGATPGLLANDSDLFGSPRYTREALTVDTYHRLMYREMQNGPAIKMVQELQLPSFWMKDPNGNYTTFNLHRMEEERVSPVHLPVSLMKADEFMDPEEASVWSGRVKDHLTDILPKRKPDVMFGYASPGEFAGNKELTKAEDLGSPGRTPTTQVVMSVEPYLPDVMAPVNNKAKSIIQQGFALQPQLV